VLLIIRCVICGFVYLAEMTVEERNPKRTINPTGSASVHCADKYNVTSSVE